MSILVFPSLHETIAAMERDLLKLPTVSFTDDFRYDPLLHAGKESVQAAHARNLI